MIVVADAGPLRYLVLIGKSQLLGELFEQVVVPAAVVDELTHSRTPEVVAIWIKHPPRWLTIVPVSSFPADSRLDHLDEGERQAIALAKDRGHSLLLMDEIEGRYAAESLGLLVLGAIGVLERAAKLHLIDFATAFKDLEQTNFHMSAALRRVIAERHHLQ
jgi:predicted nucleic acid-binding protein